jgi:hypothetical protein
LLVAPEDRREGILISTRRPSGQPSVIPHTPVLPRIADSIRGGADGQLAATSFFTLAAATTQRENSVPF